jgi:hypothetical protein
MASYACVTVGVAESESLPTLAALQLASHMKGTLPLAARSSNAMSGTARVDNASDGSRSFSSSAFAFEVALPTAGAKQCQLLLQSGDGRRDVRCIQCARNCPACAHHLDQLNGNVTEHDEGFCCCGAKSNQHFGLSGGWVRYFDRRRDQSSPERSLSDTIKNGTNAFERILYGGISRMRNLLFLCDGATCASYLRILGNLVAHAVVLTSSALQNEVGTSDNEVEVLCQNAKPSRKPRLT